MRAALKAHAKRWLGIRHSATPTFGEIRGVNDSYTLTADVCRECANSAKRRGTEKHRGIIDQRKMLMNQYRMKLRRTEENELFEIRN